MATLVVVATPLSCFVLVPAVFSLGLVVIAVQLLIPFAAHLAAHAERGQVVGDGDEWPARRHPAVPHR
jgi:hypothetical protein